MNRKKEQAFPDNWRGSLKMFCGVFDSKFSIDSTKSALALEAVKVISKGHEIWGYATGAFLDGYENLADLLEGYDFEVTRDGEGVTALTDGCMSRYDAERLFAALAPYVTLGSYLIWQGDELGDLFAFTFEDGRLATREVEAHIIY